MEDYEFIERKTDEEIEECFLHKETRVVKNDATIAYKKSLFEVPQEYIGKKITIKYNPKYQDELFIYDDNGERKCSIKPIDKNTNAKIKRKEKTSLYKAEGGSNV